MAWQITYGPIPDGLFCLHHCDNPPCVRPDHLFLGTAADNTLDMMRKGRHGPDVFPSYKIAGDRHWSHRHPEKIHKGEMVGTSKLTESQVYEIRDTKGVSISALARKYAVARCTIRRVIRRESWKHI